jgi:uncharacterized HAD superfamily protein
MTLTDDTEHLPSMENSQPKTAPLMTPEEFKKWGDEREKTMLENIKKHLDQEKLEEEQPKTAPLLTPEEFKKWRDDREKVMLENIKKQLDQEKEQE